MAWIELHQALRGHKKTLRLKRALGFECEAQAIGHLACLWMWALDNAPDGDLSGVDADSIAYAANYESGDPEKFVRALRDAGFLDGEAIHDWEDYAGRLTAMREANKLKMRKWRAEQHKKRSAALPLRNGTTVPDTTQPDRTQPTQPDITKPYPTEHDQTNKRASASAFEEFWEIYPKKSCKQNAQREFEAIGEDSRIIEALKKYVGCAQWLEAGGRFVPKAEKWLREREWTRNPPGSASAQSSGYQQREYRNSDFENDALTRMLLERRKIEMDARVDLEDLDVAE